MKRQQKPTTAQAEIIRRAALDPDAVTVTGKSAVLPLAITYHGDGGPLHRWIVRNERGALQLSDERPTFTKPTTDSNTRQPEPVAIEYRAARHDPDKLQTALQRDGHTAKEARAIVAQVCDGATIREAAQAAGISKTAVGAAKIQREVKALRAGKPLPDSQPLTAKRQPATELDLLQCAEWARKVLTPGTELGLTGLDLLKLAREAAERDRQPLARVIVGLIRGNPQALEMPEGKGLLNAFVDLLETVNTGRCKSRVPGLLTAKNPRQRKVEAGRALASIGNPNVGAATGLPALRLAPLLDACRCRVVELQTAYTATAGEPRAARLEAIRDAHRRELAGFKTDRQLQDLLTGEPLQVAAKFLERATGVSTETFLRASPAHDHRAARIRNLIAFVNVA
jgi:hypothetical protein